jgi:glycosyltransferase involved in cell wall biosynthesis
MRALILAAGRFNEATRSAIAQGKEPRLDVFELEDRLPGSELIDYGHAEASSSPLIRLIYRSLGPSAAVAAMGFQKRAEFDVILTTGEDIGIPLAAMLRPTASRVAHAMIAHTLAPPKKRVFFQALNIERRIDHVLAYASSEEKLMLEELGFERSQVNRIYYHADDQFFRPSEEPLEPDLVCAAGQLLRDYDCLIEATRDLPVRVQIAAGSPWIDKKLEPTRELPKNVSWGKLSRFELRALYARSAIAVVPIKDNVYQTGIATILEMMSMGKCVIATRTQGQTDTIVDGVTGVYVPPHDPAALRAAISHYISDPALAKRIGAAARAFVEKEAGLNLFVERMLEAMRAAQAFRSKVTS